MPPAPASLPLRVVGEVFKTYIITERNNELCLIDKHAAHERILFEQLAKDYGSVPSQMLLVPVQVNLSAEEKQALLAHQELLQNSGVEVDDYGGFTVVVRAVPADVPVDDVGICAGTGRPFAERRPRCPAGENRVGTAFHCLPRRH